MGSKTLDEERHRDDEPDPHQQDRVPVGLLSLSAEQYRHAGATHRNPLGDGKEGALVEKEILQSDQRPLRVNLHREQCDTSVQ